ncbi:hypothetical protein LAG90_15695 [Marinilongibacter aquaticus]|uniref:hypothetical protein n=1 Tax=Marinilongibacter aquaticus TaxID=2975157 RepID=UPI0021BD6C4E|nr:hypothetical protein [Marinilongibacter aquaticus]UBM58247.1 hypothetical protein LAG90_15695 [Marinilongibacter aquaticus]
MDFERPSSIPPLQDFIEPNGLIEKLLKYAIKASHQTPDHYEEPFEYITHVEYLEVVINFLNLLKNEINACTDTTKKGTTDKTLEEGKNKRS